MIHPGLKDGQKTSDLVAFLNQFDADGKKKWAHAPAAITGSCSSN